MGNKRNAWFTRIGLVEAELAKRFADLLRRLARERDWHTRNDTGKATLSIGSSISPSFLSSRLNFRDHGDLLEREWPGCSVMWDAHPELKLWDRYCLMIVQNYMACPPYESRRARVHDIGHRMYRKQNARRVEEASVEGDFILVAYQLHMPGEKPVQIAVEHSDPPSRLSPSLTWTPIRAVFTASDTPAPRWTLVR